MGNKLGIQRAERLRARGLCYICGQEPAWQPRKACEACRDRAREKHEPIAKAVEENRATRKAWKLAHPPRPCCRCARSFQPTPTVRTSCQTCYTLRWPEAWAG